MSVAPTETGRHQIKPTADIKSVPAAKAGSLPRGEYAFVSLLGAIRAGQLTPGQRVRESEIAEWLGISRTPVREALMRLEVAGLVQSASHSGFVVNRLDDAGECSRKVIENHDRTIRQLGTEERDIRGYPFLRVITIDEEEANRHVL